ncbi:urea transporter [Arthrobacter sp. LAPM80]|uniref:urea transporter n=1 Tax=Arthrobacter sp. LAPM80 TaxID=3141788 RepID=UPI00398AAB7E
MGAATARRRQATAMGPGAWLVGVVHGMSQVFFQTNILTGLLILAAFVSQDWRMAALVVLGASASSVAGQLLSTSGTDIRSGAQGFCGALIGASTYAALGGQWAGYPLAVVGGLLCAPVTWAVVWFFNTKALKRFALPSTTAPFCIVATLIFFATTGLHVQAPLTVVETNTEAFLESLLTNISQVVLVDDVWGGALILLGLFIAHWKVGLAALLGSVAGSVAALVLNDSLQETANGLSGYSGVLTAIAFATVFMKGRWEPWVFAIIGSAVTAVVTLIMHTLPGPTYTWPYILTTWAGLVLIQLAPRLYRR